MDDLLIQEIKRTIKTLVEEAIYKVFGQKPEGLYLSFPPEVKLGDLTVECFPLAKQLRQPPAEIAKKIVMAMEGSDLIQEVQAVGPYINLRIPSKVLFGDVCTDIITQGEAFGNSNIGESQRVMVEYLSPNTNKPLHLGHMRNGALGMAVANLLEATGYQVIKANLINDRGVHICRSMLAWKKWAKGVTPESEDMKGDHFVGQWYVRYAQEAEKDPGLEAEVQAMLQKWEAGEAETLRLWKTMNNWVYDGFNATYQRFGLKFDVFYYESDTYKLGKDIIAEGLEKGVFYQDAKGGIVFDLPEAEFGLDENNNPKKITVLRSEGTSVYITQDLGAALLKVNEHRLDRSIYVVGNEQNYYLQCLFKILEALGYPWARGCHHLSYGMVFLPEGKMKSREGRIVDADDLIEEMRFLAETEIRQRHPEDELSSQELAERAMKIGVGAIKFYLLRVRPTLDIHFNPQESISFDGFTGPYCQYAYARCSGILNNAEERGVAMTKGTDSSVLGKEEELLLIQKLFQFPEVVETAIEQFNPSHLTIHLYETAKAFNQFYQKHSVLSAEDEKLMKARLTLVQATAIVLKKGLNLLGLEALEEM